MISGFVYLNTFLALRQWADYTPYAASAAGYLIANSDFIKEKNLFPGFESWQDGYGAFTLSIHAKADLVKYIKNQEEHHRKKTYREELIELLKEFEVEFEEKYLDWRGMSWGDELVLGFSLTAAAVVKPWDCRFTPDNRGYGELNRCRDFGQLNLGSNTPKFRHNGTTAAAVESCIAPVVRG